MARRKKERCPAAARSTRAVIGRLRPKARKGVVIIDGAGRSGRRRRRRIVVVVVVPVFTDPDATVVLLLLLVVFVLDRLSRRIDTERRRRVVGRMAVVVRLLVNHLESILDRPAVINEIRDPNRCLKCQYAP